MGLTNNMKANLSKLEPRSSAQSESHMGNINMKLLYVGLIGYECEIYALFQSVNLCAIMKKVTGLRNPTLSNKSDS